MKRTVLYLLALILVFSATASLASAQVAPTFKLGFKALADQIPQVVGQPIEDEHWGDNGDSLQQTTTGLMVWRKADNWTAFTNGSRTWINGPMGVQERSNEDRFDWEPIVMAQPRPLEVIQTGHAQRNEELRFAFVVENRNATAYTPPTPYRVTAYDSAGQVLRTDTGSTGNVLPNRKQGIAGSLLLPEKTQAARVEIQLDPRWWFFLESRDNFSADRVAFMRASTSPVRDIVTAVVQNPFPYRFGDVRVHAVCYDSTGAIIGGGYGYLDFLPATGSTPIEISVITSGSPSRIEVYPHVLDISELTR